MQKLKNNPPEVLEDSAEQLKEAQDTLGQLLTGNFVVNFTDSDKEYFEKLFMQSKPV